MRPPRTDAMMIHFLRRVACAAWLWERARASGMLVGVGRGTGVTETVVAIVVGTVKDAIKALAVACPVKIVTVVVALKLAEGRPLTDKLEAKAGMSLGSPLIVMTLLVNPLNRLVGSPFGTLLGNPLRTPLGTSMGVLLGSRSVLVGSPIGIPTDDDGPTPS